MTGLVYRTLASRGDVPIFQRLCIRQQDSPPDADRSMSLVELRLALGVKTEALLNEAL